MTDFAATVSVGYGLSHMYRTAELLERDGVLAGLITTGYPPSWLNTSRLSGLNRLAERRLDIPDPRVSSIWISEAIWQVGARLDTLRQDAGLSFIEFARYIYGRMASKRIPNEAPIYHFRAGFGGASLSAAKENGIATVCDHSIAHPDALPKLLGYEAASQHHRQWRQVARDINHADLVLVNSDFVAQTCQEAGVPSDRLRVAYTVADTPFLRHLERTRSRTSEKSGGALKFLYAGTVEHRKGADTLVDAINMYGGPAMEFTIAGTWMPDAAADRRRLYQDRVSIMPRQPRSTLSRLMADHDVLVLPTRAEGSARVVAEAMSAGMFVLTTAEAGIHPDSPKSGRRIVAPGAPVELAAALEHLAANAGAVRDGGLLNSGWASRAMTEDNYISAVKAAYKDALDFV